MRNHEGYPDPTASQAISAGVDLDELSELLKTHHTAIFQKAWETYFENINPNPDLTGFEDDVQIIKED